MSYYFTGLRHNFLWGLVWLADGPAEGCSLLAVGKATGSKRWATGTKMNQALRDHWGILPKNTRTETHTFTKNNCSCSSCSYAPWASNSALHYNLESNMCHWHHYIKDLAFINGQRYCVYCGPDSRETGCSAAPSTSTLTHISPFLQEFLEIYHLCMEASVAPAYRRKKTHRQIDVFLTQWSSVSTWGKKLFHII